MTERRNSKPCLISSLVRDATAAGVLTAEHEKDTKGVAGALYAAATDTMSCSDYDPIYSG
ncbi:hypothetical protein WOLCODRAFT_25862 [Wolfiporia cocos MD-104 SS10]|uniref:Uncharacterized protein n=1 Tax=Wolfiporia cocos (strain MD-104) TaxID=742152 RepID=A0A2H3K2Q5_WOLCO|nr:hypothetical protein WOLCODRAFT_25862 [Wolfiporia cocos MD-104 SS10]